VDRQRLRTLGAVVRRDPALEQTLRDYTIWLDNLTPWQRQEVAASDDDDVKVAVIRRILADQKRQREEYEREQQRLVELFNAQSRRSVPQFNQRPGFADWERLKPDELATALEPLEESVPTGSRPAPPPADGHCAENRNLEILSAALKHYSARPEFHDEPIPRPVLAAVVAELPDGRRKQFYEEQIEKPFGPRFLTLMFVKIASENWWDAARRERRMPRSRAEIEALVAKLSEENQAEFARLQSQSTQKAFEAYARLLRAYHDLWMEEKEAEFNRRFTELREIIKKLDFQGPLPDPFGGGRSQSPGNRGPRGDSDDRRGGFGRGSSERGRDFNRHDDRGERDGRDDKDGRNDRRDERQPVEKTDEPARAE
jgi:hypothetical protein